MELEMEKWWEKEYKMKKKEMVIKNCNVIKIKVSKYFQTIDSLYIWLETRLLGVFNCVVIEIRANNFEINDTDSAVHDW